MNQVIYEICLHHTKSRFQITVLSHIKVFLLKLIIKFLIRFEPEVQIAAFNWFDYALSIFVVPFVKILPQSLSVIGFNELFLQDLVDVKRLSGLGKTTFVGTIFSDEKIVLEPRAQSL